MTVLLDANNCFRLKDETPTPSPAKINAERGTSLSVGARFGTFWKIKAVMNIGLSNKYDFFFAIEKNIEE